MWEWFTRPTRAQVALIKAADELETNGWIQGEFFFNGKHCAAGAIQKVTRDIEDSSEAIDLLMQELGEGVHITTWNDEPGQTAENVIETMRRAARK